MEASENEGSDHVATRELCYLLMQEIGERFELIDKLTFILFNTSLNHGRAEEGGKKILAGSLPSFLALVLPHFFSRSPFFSLPTRAWNRLLAIELSDSKTQPAWYNFHSPVIFPFAQKDAYPPEKISTTIYKSCIFRCLAITKAQLAISYRAFLFWSIFEMPADKVLVFNWIAGSFRLICSKQGQVVWKLVSTNPGLRS